MSVNAWKIGAAVGLGSIGLAAGYGTFRLIQADKAATDERLHSAQKNHRKLAAKLHDELPTADSVQGNALSEFTSKHDSGSLDVWRVQNTSPGTHPYRVIANNRELVGNRDTNAWLAIGAGLAALTISGTYVAGATNAGLAASTRSAGPLMLAAAGAGAVLGGLAGRFVPTEHDGFVVVYPSGETRAVSLDRDSTFRLRGSEPAL